MTFGGQVRLAGAVIMIVSVFIHSIVLNFLGLLVMLFGTFLQVDELERRVTKLEPKENDDETPS